MKIYAYVYRERNNCFLPRDVLNALGQPGHARQGRLYVFAPTAEAAWRRLNTLDLAPRSARALARAGDRTARVLAAAALGREGAVYAMPMNGPSVVSIWQDISDRIIDRIGEIRQGEFTTLQAIDEE